MWLDRKTGSIQHRKFLDLPELLKPGDAIVTNNARVIPARLRGEKVPTGGKIEIFLLRKEREGVWRALAQPGRRLHEGTKVRVGTDGDRWIELRISEKPGGAEVLVELPVGVGDTELLRLGEVPLPPYIHEPLKDAERYQTVFAKVEGAVAAPTASLHFDDDVLTGMACRGIQRFELTLLVGPTSFLPVKTERVEDHRMTEEWFNVPGDVAAALTGIRRSGGRIVAAGTTVVRTLETCAQGKGIAAGSGQTKLFITPGYAFRAVDVLITNFHMPASTHLALVAAFAGLELARESYRQALAETYRFLSFGDAMLIT